MTTHRAARVARLAWLATFVVPLILVTLLLGVTAAHAASASIAAAPALVEEFEAEDEEGEFEEGDCEEAEFEFEEEEIGEADFERLCEEEAKDNEAKATAAGSGSPPEECVLRSTNARVVAFDSHDDLRLTVGYTTYKPTVATIDYGVGGGKGSLHLGTVKRHLGKSGVIRLTKALSDPEMDKVDAAGHFVVRLHVAGSPGLCRRFETEQLSVERGPKSQAVWSRASR